MIRQLPQPAINLFPREGQSSMSDLSYEALLESFFDGVYYVNLEKKISFWNKGAERITGYTKEEVYGSCCSANILQHLDDDGQELCLIGCPLSATMRDGQVRESTMHLHHKQGHRVPVSVKISPVRAADGTIIGGLEVFSDNSSALQVLKELESLKHEVFLDGLTKVGNRRYGEVTLKTRIDEWESQNLAFGVIFLDIDHFKQINDTFGHNRGDEVLLMVSSTIFNILRRMDTVSRWGGEEFVILLPNITPDYLKIVAGRIRAFIERSFILINRDKVAVTASLGATMVRPQDTPETIIHRADSLMYASKKAGRNFVTIG